MAPSMPTARQDAAATVGSDGRIYVLGGSREPVVGAVNGDRTVEIFDPATNVWSAGPRLPAPRVGLAAATGADGRIYAIGGATNGSDAPVEATVWVYRP